MDKLSFFIKHYQRQITRYCAINILLLSPITSMAATATVNVTANLMPAVTMTKTSDLSFSNIAPPANASTVVIAAGGSPATKNGSPSISNPGSAANFTLAGNASATFAVTLPSSITLTGPEGATMSVTPLANTILTPMGTTTLSIGGILNVAGAQTKGKYTGKFVLTLDQN